IFNNQGQVLMQIRSANNARDAGMLDICSGQVQSGETDFHAAAREIVEELGKRAITQKELSEIKEIGSTRMDFRKYGRKGNYLVIWNALMLERQIPDSDFDLQEEEVQNVQWMDYEEIKEGIRSGKNNIRIPNVEQTEEMLKKLDAIVYKKERDTGDR
ncbi:MAG: NUDIX domain-containing protein, partial [Clostridia bacterium]